MSKMKIISYHLLFGKTNYQIHICRGDKVAVNNNEKSEKGLQKEAFLEYMQSIDELRKERKKKFFVIGSIGILIILFIKIFFGTVEVYNPFGYPASKARYYKVTVNDKPVAVAYTLIRKIPVIPYLFYLNSVYLGNSSIGGDNNDAFFFEDGSSKYVIDVHSYNCYYNTIQIECQNNEQTMKPNMDEKYPMLTITRISKPYEVVYQGKFIKDIAPYVKEKGQYHIEITSKYSFNESKIYFYFNTLKREE